MKSLIRIFLCASSITLLPHSSIAGMWAFSNTARPMHRKVNDIIYWKGGGKRWNKRFLLNGTWKHKRNEEEKTRYWITSYAANDASNHPNQMRHGLIIKDRIIMYTYKRIVIGINNIFPIVVWFPFLPEQFFFFFK